MDTIIQKVFDTVKKENMIQAGDRILVGFSGGADSLFLILSLLELKKFIDFEFAAAHMNHGIRGDEAKRDEQFVEGFCLSEKIKLFIKSVNIPEISKEQRISEESAGRNERYKFFNEICSKNNFNKIAVAHNMNDSVETVILNMIRGSSLKGLCGIRPVNENIIRPIINITRDQIEEHLQHISMSYCTDSTNLTVIYTRNKIRHQIISTMSEINNSVIDTIHSNTANLRNDEDFINKYACDLQCITTSGNDIIINKNIFEHQHPSVKNRILTDAFQKINGNCNNITCKHLDIISSADSSGKSFDMPGNVTVTISFDKIIFTKQKQKKFSYEYEYSPEDSLEFLPGISITSSYCNTLDPDCKDAIYIDADLLKSQTITVRNRRAGDKFIPYGMKNNKKIKQLFIELKIPSYNRDEVPLLLDNGEIIAIVPYRVSELYKVTDKTKRILKINITKEK